MKKWKVKLPGGRIFELESDTPEKVLMEQGHTAFDLEEIVPLRSRAEEKNRRREKKF